jgi:MFS family permease
MHGADVRRVILVSFVPGVVVVVLALWAVKGGRGRATAEVVAPPSPAFVRLPPPVIAIGIFYLIRMPETLIILRAQQLGIAVALIPLLWAAVHVIKSSSSFIGGALSDRLGPSITMWIGWLSYVGLAAGMALAKDPLAAWILFLALGVVAGLTESPERALVSAATGGHRGSAFGAYHALTGVAALIGGVALGGLFGATGGATAFYVSAGATLGLVLVWPFWSRAHRVPPR